MAQIPDTSAVGNLGGATEKGGVFSEYFCNRFRMKPDNTGRGRGRNVCSSMGRDNTGLAGPGNIHLKHTEVLADKLSVRQRVISGQLEMLKSQGRQQPGPASIQMGK